MYLELEPYLKFHKNYKSDWIKFNEQLTNSLNANDFRDELTPLYGTKYYDDFSDSEKEKLFIYFIQFQAEVISFLEKLLLISFRSLREDVRGVHGLDGVLKFMGEELYHSFAFTQFLSHQKQLNFPNQKIVVLPTLVRDSLIRFLKYAPLGVCLPAVKLEAYSIAYWDFMKQYYTKDENDWVKLNRFHAVDEIKHVPIHFEFFRCLLDKTRKTSRLRTILASYYLIFCLQITLFVSIRNVLKLSVPRLSKIENLKYTLKIGKWNLRDIPVYKETRKMTKECFDANELSFKKLFNFMYW